jgi:DNA-binding MarR family transcriptional regulator
MSPSLEVAMRPPEVFVRELAVEEGARLKSISKRAKHQSKRARAMILLASSTGMSAPQIAELMRSDESHVRKVIHAFNEQGFSWLDPDYRGGRPKKTTPEQRDRIVAVARAPPRHAGHRADALVADQARRAPCGPGCRAVRGGAAPGAARCGAVASAHALVEVEPGPGLRRQGRAGAGRTATSPTTASSSALTRWDRSS